MTAVAVATASSENGASVVANSQATGSGVSVVNAEGSGNVTVVCRQQAGNDETKFKECIDNKKKEEGNKTWAEAPRCTNPTKDGNKIRVQYDNGVNGDKKDRRPWGWEQDTQTSCALK
jgi:hypothetical protein